uniref:DOP1-like C-terminal domain-containing protein n=1 Tax=Parascaris equorum TaxID=6256 RepID=A0A914RST4_PAREQ
MRPVWRKATLDLLLDPGIAWYVVVLSKQERYFVMDRSGCLINTDFEGLKGANCFPRAHPPPRISTTQNSALSSLITSKEAEYEMRAQALKRLAFIVLSSELDHNMGNMISTHSALLASVKTCPQVNNNNGYVNTGCALSADGRPADEVRIGFLSERLSDSLRPSQVPNLHAQVFLCYRVLLLRLKPNHLVSMWPSMVTELVGFPHRLLN